MRISQAFKALESLLSPCSGWSMGIVYGVSGSENELVTMFDKWMFALRNLSRLLERPKALQERIFTRLFDQAEIARFSPNVRREYQESIKDYWDYYSTMTTSYNKGKAEGKDEANRENARKMKEFGVSPAIISQVTGLTTEETEKV